MKILGIDFGTVRIGLAIQIEGVEIPLETIEHRDYRKSLKEIFSQREIDLTVIGLPISMSGRFNQLAMKAVSFAEKVKKIFSGRVILTDERLTTKSSERIAKNSGLSFSTRRDMLSAMEILRNYSRGTTANWEVRDLFPICRNFSPIDTGKKALLYAPLSSKIEGLDSTKEMDVYVEDPQIYFSFLKKGFTPKNLLDDIDFSTYDIIVVTEGDKLPASHIELADNCTVHMCSWLNG